MSEAGPALMELMASTNPELKLSKRGYYHNVFMPDGADGCQMSLRPGASLRSKTCVQNLPRKISDGLESALGSCV
jgi:hypothetical protein